MLVGGVVTANVALGGMRAITFVQAFQYWLKLTALAVPVLFLLLHWQGDGRPEVTPPEGAVFREATAVVLEQDATLRVAVPTVVEVAGAGRQVLPVGDHEFTAGTRLEFPAGAAVPEVDRVAAARGADWLLPGDPSTD